MYSFLLIKLIKFEYGSNKDYVINTLRNQQSRDKNKNYFSSTPPKIKIKKPLNFSLNKFSEYHFTKIKIKISNSNSNITVPHLTHSIPFYSTCSDCC